MRINHWWKTGETLDYEVYDIGGSGQIVAATQIPETSLLGFYSVDDDNVLPGHKIVITVNATGDVIGGGVAEETAIVTPAGYVGDFEINDVVYFLFKTNRTISNAGNGLRVFKNNETSPLITAQATLDINVGSETLVHSVSVILGKVNYELETDYTVVLSGAKIGGDVITAIVGSFSIQNRYQEPVARHVHP